MEQYNSKVYIQTDGQGRIIRCEGGYTTPKDLTGWTYIDEGVGDKFNLCQSHYFEGGLFTIDGIPRYKLVGGKPVLRTDDEIVADRKARPEPEPNAATLTQLAIAELAQVVEDNNTATQLAIAELAEAMIGGEDNG